MQVRVFGQYPHTHATPQQPYATNEGKEPKLHPGMLPGARLKHPRNTEPIAGEEPYAKGEGRRMQIVHPQTAGQHHQHAHVHEGGEPARHGVASEFTRERAGGRRPPSWATMLPAHRPGAAVGVTLDAPVLAAIRSILTTP